MSWKENKFKEFIPKDGILATAEEWRTWTIASLDKLDAVGDAWFVAAAESLVIEDDVFQQIVNHPVPDVLNSNEFRTAVVNLAVFHGCVFAVAADNTNPTTGVKLGRNYNDIVKRMKAIQSQLSNSCADTMETCFTIEQREMHPLRSLRTWKRMSRSFHEIRTKDRGQCMTDLQKHASNITNWELDALTQWIADTESLRQDLLKSGHSEQVADDCIVDNMLDALTNIPTNAPFHKDWDHDSWKWKADHEENGTATWLSLKSRMEGRIKTFSRKQRRADMSSDRPAKKTRVETPAGMALLATESLATAAKSLAAVANQLENKPDPGKPAPQTRTRAQAQNQQAASGKGKKGKATIPQQAAQPQSGSDLRKDGAGNIIKCDLCAKVGISLPDSNHIVRDCPNLRESISKLSNPTLQGPGVQSSRQYVPPAGTGHAHAGISRTPQSTGADIANAMFGPSATTGFGFLATHIDPSLPEFSAPGDDDHAPHSKLVQHPDFQRNSTRYFCYALMFLGVLSVVSNVYTAYLGIYSTFASLTTTVTAVIAFPTAAMRSTHRPAITANQTSVALLSLQGTAKQSDVYFLDSGCSYSIISNATVFSTMYDVPPHKVEGLTGSRTLARGGTVVLVINDSQGSPHQLIIENALYDPQSNVNLLSAKQMNDAGYGVMLMPDEDRSGIIAPPRTWINGTTPVFLPIIQINNVFVLIPADAMSLKENMSDHPFAYNASRFKNMLLEESLHLRFHVPIEKMLKMNGKVKGLPRPIRKSRATTTSCLCCAEANATKQDRRDASTTVYTRDNDLWHIDMFDLGEQYKTLDGNRYGTIIVARSSRYALLYLHSDRQGTTVAKILKQARAKFGYWPKSLRSDNAMEYQSEEISSLCTEYFIDREWSNEYEQEQNAVVEQLVHVIGKGIRVCLLQSGLPIEFWGLAALHAINVYNILPHASLNFEIPYTIQTGRLPDLSWFRPFGCQAIVHLGKDLAEHHKAAPRGESGVYVGIGLLSGCKAWLVYSACLHKIYATCNATFDDTLFPSRATDQRVYGYFDNEPVHTFRADLHDKALGSTLLPASIDSPSPVWVPTDAAERDDILSAAGTAPSSPVLISSPPDLSCGDGGGCKPGGGFTTASPTVDNVISDPGGGRSTVPSSPAGSNRTLPNQRYKKGKRLRFGDKMEQLNTNIKDIKHWKDCASTTIANTADNALAEYLIGYALEFTLPNSYWPKDKGEWTISCSDTVIAGNSEVARGYKRGAVLMVGTIIHGPKEKQIGQTLKVPISGQYSIRQAIKEAHPSANVMKDILLPSIRTTSNTTRSRTTRLATRVTKLAKFCLGFDNHTSRIRMDGNSQHCFLAFTALTQLIGMQKQYGFKAAYLPPEPKTQNEARKRPDFQSWIDSEWVEMDTVYNMGTITYVPNSSVPDGVTCIPTKFTYKCKFGDVGQVIKKKARIVVRGDLQYDTEYAETYAPTSRFNTLRTLISVAAQQDLKLMQFDVRGAFMVAPIDDKDIYVQLPPGYEAPDGFTAKLSSSLYGLRDAAFRFHKTLADWMTEYGFVPLDPDRTMFKLERDGATIIVATYVDDGLCAHDSDSEYLKFIVALSERFELSAPTEEVSWYLGVSIQRDWINGTIKLSQKQYVCDLLERFQMNEANTAITPMEIGQRLSTEEVQAEKDTVKAYQQLMGSLNYLNSWTRPDVAYPISQCAKFMTNPSPTHVGAAKRILRYLKGTMDIGITYTRDLKPANQLYAYADADHAGDPEGRRSITGYVVLLNGGAVSWESKRQQLTALSSAESEYYAASACGCDISYLRRVLETMGYEQHGPTLVGEDNVACIHMSESSAMFHKGKHIDVRVYRLREFVADKVMKLYYINTSSQVADTLTKSLPSDTVRKHRDIMAGFVPGNVVAASA